MTDQELLQQYIPLVDFVADVCGTNYEVLLHDVSKPEASVVAIRNGHHSGRTVGSPMTDLALKILRNKTYLERDYIANYSGNTKDRQFYSSTLYIKNEDRLVGMLCVNNDMMPLNDFKSSVQALLSTLQFGEDAVVSGEYSENLGNPLASLANTIISRTIANFNVPTKRMSSDEKQRIVQELNEQGVLMLKGAVAEIAQQLHISEGTVYRYTNKK